MLGHVKYKIARAVQCHPYLWYAAWTIAHKVTFLLPHDRSYYAIRHFGGTHDDLLVDIGANDGISAMSFRKLNPNIRILSLEPNPLHRPSLQMLKEKMGNFDFLMVGADDVGSEIRLFSPCYKSIALHTFTSGSIEQVKSALTKSFGSAVAIESQIVEFTVRAVRLDDLELTPRIIKIDVEGFDYKVLLGARTTLTRCRPFITIEACHIDLEPIRRYFGELDYVMLSFDPARDRFARLRKDTSDWAIRTQNVFAAPSESLSTLPLEDL